MKYPGESWQNEIARANLAEAQRPRQAEQEREASRPRRRAARLQADPPARQAPPTPEPTRRTWRDLSPAELNRF